MYIDIYAKARSDKSFRDEMRGLATMISQAEVAARKNPAAKQVFANSMQTMLKKCNYNPGFLVPHFFPCYPKQQPLSLAARPFSYSMFAMQVGGFTVVRASRQVGKSTSFGARQLMNAHMLPNYRSLYIVPHEEHRKTYANRLREMERAFTYKTHSATHRQNLNYKEYPNGSIIELISVWTSADESRGKTTDELLFDECQHLDATLLPEIEQTQKASSIPTTIYAGTSLTVDTLLETRWLQSSQGVWMLRGSRGWLNTGDQETVVSMIRRQGLCDPHTGRLLDVRDGEYVHADRRALEDGYVGLHIPQVIIPDMVESPIEWEKIWRAFVEYDRKKFLQEVLGQIVELFPGPYVHVGGDEFGLRMRQIARHERTDDPPGGIGDSGTWVVGRHGSDTIQGPAPRTVAPGRGRR